MPPPQTQPHTRSTLLTSAKTFCSAFANKDPLPQILSNFTSTSPSQIHIHEHGLPQLAPFLGRTFTGLDGATEYFTILSDCLSYEDMTFGDEGGWIVDVESGKVVVKGRARFTWVETGQSWDEVFVYVLGFDVGEGGDGKVVRYEVWADSGAAYLARKGTLG